MRSLLLLLLVAIPLGAQMVLDFDGATSNGTTYDCGSAPDIDNIAASHGGITISMWMRADSSGPSVAGGYFLAKYSGGGWFAGVSDAQSQPDNIRFYSDLAVSFMQFYGGTASMPTVWSHIMISWDGVDPAQNYNIWINGQAINLTLSSGGSGAPVDDSAKPLYVGNRNTLDRTFNGPISGISIWGGVATDQQAQTLASLPSAKFAMKTSLGPPLRLLIPSGTDLMDISPNQGHCTSLVAGVGIEEQMKP